MKVITISREYGAGGHSIGRRVAQELGIEFYDKDIIRETAKAAGIDISSIESEEEQISLGQTIIRSITPVSYDPKEAIYEIQHKVIADIAAKGSCVILGRLADFILEEAGIDSLNVFIHADTLHRAKRVGELLNTDNISEIQKKMKKMDRARHAYYTHFTGKRWDECHNFDLTLDSGSLGYDTCVKLICEAAKAE